MRAMPRARATPSLPEVPPGLRSPGWLARFPLVRIALLALAIRMLSVLLAFGANVLFPLHLPEQFTILGQTHAFWDTLARWDSGWYVGIARDGYAYVPGGRSNLAFFPAYPLAMRAVGGLLGGETPHYFFGGVVVSWLAFAGAMVMLWKLARLDLSAEDADRAVLYAAVFPFAFFFGLAYSESLYLLLMVSAFYAVRTGHWLLAAAAGAIAMVSRVNAIMALPALAWLAWRTAAGDRHRLVSATLALLAMTLGFAAWCGYNYMLSGNPLEWMSSITRWGYYPGQVLPKNYPGLVVALWTRPYEFLLGEPMAPYDTLNGLTALAFLAAVPFVWWRLGVGYGLFMLANLVLPLSSDQFEGMGRYCAVLFPMPIFLASVIRSATPHHLLLFVYGTFYMLVLALFVNVHPIF